MKKVIDNNTAVSTSKMFKMMFVLLTICCLLITGKSFGKSIEKADTMKTFSFAYDVEMNHSEELVILEEVMSAGVEEVVEIPVTVKVYAANGNLLYQTSGSQLALMQDQKLNQLLQDSDLMMEMANEFYYLKK